MPGSQFVHVRLRRRLLRHHLPLFLGATLSIGVLYFTRPYQDWVSRSSFATAYPALVLLSLTLLLGPWNILRRSRNPVSSDLRRDIGIWAAIVGILHSVIGQNVHLRGRPWLYYIYSAQEHHHFPIRHDLFGFANFTGVAGFLLLTALLVASNDLSLQALGTRQWKRLQRWNYALFALAAAHAIGYMAIEKQKLPFIATVAACLAITISLQLAGFILRRTQLIGQIPPSDP